MANKAVGLMPKKEFVKRVANELGVTQIGANLIIETIESVILNGLQDYNKVKFGDLVSFTKQDVPSRVYRLPGETVDRVSEPYTRVIPEMVEQNRRLKKQTGQEENE